MSELRKGLREVNASFTLAKKTLIKLAMKEIYNVELDYDLLPGQIAVVCSYDDAIAGMTKANDFIKAKADRKLGEIKITWSASYFE
jgi:ribosomal protein L10